MQGALQKLLPNRHALSTIAAGLALLSPLLVLVPILSNPSRPTLEVVRIFASDQAPSNGQAATNYKPLGEFRLTNTTQSPIYLMGESIDDQSCEVRPTDKFESHQRSNLGGRHRVYAGGPNLQIAPGESILLHDTFREEREDGEEAVLNYAVVWYAHEPFGMSRFELTYNAFLDRVGLGNQAIGGDTQVFPAATETFEINSY